MKYGIWKIRYTQNAANTFEDWVRSERAPVLFATEIGALEYKCHLEITPSSQSGGMLRESSAC